MPTPTLPHLLTRQVSELFRKTHDQTLHVAEVDDLGMDEAVESVQMNFLPKRTVRLTRQPGFLFGLGCSDNQLGPGVYVATAAEDGIGFMQVGFRSYRSKHAHLVLRSRRLTTRRPVALCDSWSDLSPRH